NLTITPLVTKSGTKFNDLNGNGVRNTGEPGLPGWTIEAFVDSNFNGVLDQNEFNAGPAGTAVTDANGNYSLTLLSGQQYIFVEVQQSGWTQSFPSTNVLANGLNTGAITLGTRGYAELLQDSQNYPGNDFGNYQNATKSGVKFNDLNGDGVRQAGEP